MFRTAIIRDASRLNSKGSVSEWVVFAEEPKDFARLPVLIGGGNGRTQRLGVSLQCFVNERFYGETQLKAGVDELLAFSLEKLCGVLEVPPCLLPERKGNWGRH
ncbi:hypothetical protein GCM10010520_53230 [Rhizobium viscosum]